MILITGAGGKTGKAVVKMLTGIESVCGIVHRDEDVSTLISLGVEKVVVGDMQDPSVLRSALRGARAVYHICPNMHPHEGEIGKLLLDSASSTGIEHFVYHSVLHPQAEKMAHHWQKLRVEEMIYESGLPFTILQPAPYMQNLLAGMKNIIEDGVLRVPYSVDSKFSFVDLEDIAETARVVLSEPGHLHATYELAGTLPMSHAEVAELFGNMLEGDVLGEREEIRDWRLRAHGLSEYGLENLVRMFEYYDKWGLMGNPNVLRWLLKREPTSIELFIRRSLGQT